MREEIWKEIDDTDGRYEISNYGRCRTTDGYIRKPSTLNSGYLSYNLYVGKCGSYHLYRAILVHRVVADKFLPKPPSDYQYVIHKDGDKTNNFVGNLQWSSQRRKSLGVSGRPVSVVCKEFEDSVCKNTTYHNSKSDCAKYIGCGYTTLLRAINKNTRIFNRYEITVGVSIMVDMVQVVEKLDELGLIRANRVIGSYYQIACPSHNDGNERHPSCGILLHDEVRNGQKYQAGFCHCFACQYSATLPEMIELVLKRKKITSKSGLDWLKENIPGFEEPDFDYLIPPELHKKLVDTFAVNYVRSIVKPEIEYVPEEELAKYRFTVDYMYDRKLNDEIIEKFDVGVDTNFIPEGRKRAVPTITFPVRDKTGGTLFVYRRSMSNKMFFMPESLEKPVYGIYELPEKTKSVILCESIFNALTCWVYGYPALALFGTGTPSQIRQLKTLGCKEFVLGLDPDTAGNRGSKRLKNALKDIAIIRRIEGIPDGKDINDLTKEEFVELYNNRY